ncbi:helicase-related protein [Hyphobacterium sp. HN65]|uniref:Helicase-related protein n=1 Tax=Hyphobacterium lacteum TaxID=3116575 RepID=A0ABU7LQ58_9PROT|nr:helicase-related protein [Hyphobacterium sp. HN65]MEE2526045.1 helicase-related protein [Hyphobacterium sp. HN65]
MSAYSALTAVLGPTNTGKTHLAVERMLARRSGMIGLPLRLLAREIYDRVVKEKGYRATALVTGEEKIVPPGARYFICTVEAMPLSFDAAFVAIDEIQLAADPERGHVFTDRILHARGTEETMLLGAETMRPVIRHLVPDADIITRERFSTLTYGGPAKLARLPRRSAIVAFSSESVYSIAELMRRQRGGAAVVMGALSPRTRNAQVELYQSGEVDYLIATDAIGMGLNMNVDHVAFAEREKFDGRRRRQLFPHEIGQIAGRAGRFRQDGTFGEAGQSKPFETELIAAIENHSFVYLDHLQWRNSDLDLRSIERLQSSLARPSRDPMLRRTRETIDEMSLNQLAQDPAIGDMGRTPQGTELIWDVCRIPDFRKVSLDAHVRLINQILGHLRGPQGRIPVDAMAAQFDRLDKTGGDVQVLSQRLAQVRTWAYVAHRGDWAEEADVWRERAREVEDRLSDALHDHLTQRFVDRRTAALVKGLRADKALETDLLTDGAVMVEGHTVGHLEGLVFRADAEGSALEARALRQAAEKALRPEINRRLGALARTVSGDLTIRTDARIEWNDWIVARLVPGAAVHKPGIALIGGELGSIEACERAKQNLQAQLHDRIARKLAPLVTLLNEDKAGELPGLARGLAFRLAENGGAIARRAVEEDVRHLSPQERRGLRQLGIRIGEFAVFMPALIKPEAASLSALLRSVQADDPGRLFLPAPGLMSVPSDDRFGPADLAAAGFQRCGPRTVRIDMLERLADTIRDVREKESKRDFEPTPAMTSLMGCSVQDLRGVLNALGYRRVKKGPDPEKAKGERWARRHLQHRKAAAAPPAPVDTPFAALAELKPSLPANRPRRKPRKTAKK